MRTARTRRIWRIAATGTLTYFALCAMGRWAFEPDAAAGLCGEDL